MNIYKRSKNNLRLAKLDKLRKEIVEAREQVKRGEIYTHEEMMKKFGLWHDK